MSVTRVRSAPHRPDRRHRHGALSMRAAGAADPARGRRVGTEAVPDHRRARPQLHRLHALRLVAARQARAATGPAAEPRDRAPLRDGGRAARATGRTVRRTPARRVLAAAARERGRRLSARGDARPRLRPVRRAVPRRDHGGGGTRAVRRQDDRRDARLRNRGGDSDAPDRDRRPRGVGAHPLTCRDDPHGLRRRDRARCLRARLPRRRPPREDLGAVDDLPAGQGRRQLERQARAREAPRRRRSAGRRAQDPGQPPRLRRRAADPRRRRLDQHEAADDRAAARQGRPDRLLDLLVHQLPAHAAAPRRRGMRPIASRGS